MEQQLYATYSGERKSSEGEKDSTDEEGWAGAVCDGTTTLRALELTGMMATGDSKRVASRKGQSK